MRGALNAFEYYGFGGFAQLLRAKCRTRDNDRDYPS
jgi:hypothetical protein